jgi:hypothetical protein
VAGVPAGDSPVRIPRLEFEQIAGGDVGETVVSDEPCLGDKFWVRGSPRQPPVFAEVVDVWAVDGGHAVLLRKVAPPKRPSAPPRLRLTRAQRAKLFNGESPHIGGEGKCPVEAGQEIQLSARVTLRVLRVDFKVRRWALHYELVDRRDVPRLLRRVPPTHAEGDEDVTPTPHAIREASEQSSYTSSPRSAVPDAGEAPPRVWLEVRAKARSEFDHQRRLARHAEKLRARSKNRRKRAA